MAQFSNYYQFDSNQGCEPSQILYLLGFKNYSPKCFLAIKKGGRMTVTVRVRVFKFSYAGRNIAMYSKTFTHIHVRIPI